MINMLSHHLKNLNRIISNTPLNAIIIIKKKEKEKRLPNFHMILYLIGQELTL
jgi:hypothetical protein